MQHHISEFHLGLHLWCTPRWNAP